MKLLFDQNISYRIVSKLVELKSRYKDIEHIDIPKWQLKEVRLRLDNHQVHPEQALDFEQAMDDIEKDM